MAGVDPIGSIAKRYRYLAVVYLAGEIKRHGRHAVRRLSLHFVRLHRYRIGPAFVGLRRLHVVGMQWQASRPVASAAFDCIGLHASLPNAKRLIDRIAPPSLIAGGDLQSVANVEDLIATDR